MAKFVKGQSGDPRGRKKGVPNKKTDLARQAIANFVDGNTVKFDGWLEEIYKEHGALAAFNCVKDLIEYHVPKLSRSEVEVDAKVSTSSILADLDDPNEDGINEA